MRSHLTKHGKQVRIPRLSFDTAPPCSQTLDDPRCIRLKTGGRWAFPKQPRSRKGKHGFPDAHSPRELAAASAIRSLGSPFELAILVLQPSFYSYSSYGLQPSFLLLGDPLWLPRPFVRN